MDRTKEILDLYDLYVMSLSRMLQGNPDKETIEAVRKFLKDEGITAEVADRKAAVEAMDPLTEGLPSFDPSDLL